MLAPSLLARTGRVLLLLALASAALPAQGPENVLLVVNTDSPVSRGIGEYYAAQRKIPAANICRIDTVTDEEIDRSVYDRRIAVPIADCLRKQQLVEQILYIVTTAGVPLRIRGPEGVDTDRASVDSELTLLYQALKTGRRHAVKGFVRNPFFNKKTGPFNHARFPIYLVTRLAAYDLAGARAIIDRALAARNRGKFVLDLDADDNRQGNNWLRAAATSLPEDRVVLDTSTGPVYGETGVIGYASWGSNDKNHHERFVNFKWLPGAIAIQFVSNDARTFARPPKDWNISNDWRTPENWFAGEPQSLTADFLLEGASAATGHVAEPYLSATPRPDILLPAYFSGRNLAESFYMSIPFLSWQNIVVGDPLMSLGPPE